MPANTAPYNSTTYSQPPINTEMIGTSSVTSVGNPTSVPPTFPDGQNITPNEGVPNTPVMEQVKFFGGDCYWIYYKCGLE